MINAPLSPEILSRALSQKMRLSVASRIAAGVVSNPETYKMQSWESEVARMSLRIADRIIASIGLDGDA